MESRVRSGFARVRYQGYGPRFLVSTCDRVLDMDFEIMLVFPLAPVFSLKVVLGLGLGCRV